MGLRYNPFTGSFDLTRSPGSYLDGEVATYGDLPLDTAAAPLNSAWLVRGASGLWLLSRKPAGIYIRTATTGVRDADYTYAGAFPDVFSDANFVVYNDTDSTKNLKLDTSAITTGTTRTISVPDKNVTLDDSGDARTPTAHASSHAAAGTKAQYNDQVSGMTENVFIRADTAGTAGNSITLAFNGTDDIDTVLAAWNSANPSNQATLISGDNGQVPDNGEEIVLSGGISAGADPLFDQDLNTGDSVEFAGIDVTGTDSTPDIKLKGRAFLGNASGSTGFVTDSNAPFHPPETFGFAGVNEEVTEYRPVGFTTGYYAQLFLATSGDIGIGTAYPNAKLDVAGNVIIRDTADEENGPYAATFDANANLTANRTYDLPDANGTLVLDSQLGTAATADIGTAAGEVAEGNHTHAASEIVSGTLDNARINFAAPAPIGSTTSSSGAFTTLSASTSLTIGTSGILVGGTNLLEQRNGTSAQELRIFNTFTSATNRENGFLRWSSNVFQIGTEKGSGGGTARGLELRTDNTARLTIGSAGTVTLNTTLAADAQNISTDTTTGTKIGTGTTQKIGFFNATPVVQQAAVADATDAASTQARLNDLLARLRTLGLIAT